MKKCFCLLNHNLTQKQIDELKSKYTVTDIVYPPQKIAELWLQIPTKERIQRKEIILPCLLIHFFTDKDLNDIARPLHLLLLNNRKHRSPTCKDYWQMPIPMDLHPK